MDLWRRKEGKVEGASERERERQRERRDLNSRMYKFTQLLLCQIREIKTVLRFVCRALWSTSATLGLEWE